MNSDNPKRLVHVCAIPEQHVCAIPEQHVWRSGRCWHVIESGGIIEASAYCTFLLLYVWSGRFLYTPIEPNPNTTTQMIPTTDTHRIEDIYLWSLFQLLYTDNKQKARDASAEVLMLSAEVFMLKKQLSAANDRELILKNAIAQIGYDKNLRGRMSAMSKRFELHAARLEEDNQRMRRELARVVCGAGADE